MKWLRFSYKKIYKSIIINATISGYSKLNSLLCIRHCTRCFHSLSIKLQNKLSFKIKAWILGGINESHQEHTAKVKALELESTSIWFQG